MRITKLRTDRRADTHPCLGDAACGVSKEAGPAGGGRGATAGASIEARVRGTFHSRVNGYEAESGLN